MGKTEHNHDGCDFSSVPAGRNILEHCLRGEQ